MPACPDAIDGATAQKIFEKLNRGDAGEGCTLEQVDTQRAEMKIVWKKGADLTEPILVVPAACAAPPRAGAKLSATVPPSAKAACPKSVEAAVAFIEAGEVAPVVMSKAPSVPGAALAAPSALPQPYVFAAAGGVAILAAATVLLLRRRKKPPATP